MTTSREREELQFIKSYLSHQDQDANHEFIVRRINDVLAGKDPAPDITQAVEEMRDDGTCPECKGTNVVEEDGTGALGYPVKKACPRCSNMDTVNEVQEVLIESLQKMHPGMSREQAIERLVEGRKILDSISRAAMPPPRKNKPTPGGGSRFTVPALSPPEKALNEICMDIDEYVGHPDPKDDNYCTYYEATYDAGAVARRVKRLINDMSLLKDAVNAIAAIPADHIAKMPWESIKVLTAAINQARQGETNGPQVPARVRPVDEGSGGGSEVRRPFVGEGVQGQGVRDQEEARGGRRRVAMEEPPPWQKESEAFLKEHAPAVHPHHCITPPQRAEPLWKCSCGQQWYLKIDAGSAFWTKEKSDDEKLWEGLNALDNDKYEIAGFMSALGEVENFISFMMRAGTGEDFTAGYNQALMDLKEFVKKQKTFEGKELLTYETRSSDGERVRKDRWETAIRNIAHHFFGPTGSWEIEDVVEEAWKAYQQANRAKLEAQEMRERAENDPTFKEGEEAPQYGRGVGMTRAPDDLPNDSRAAWLRHPVSSWGQKKVYQPQYEELRVHTVDLWKRLKTIKEATR
jgi:hypothetical protein